MYTEGQPRLELEIARFHDYAKPNEEEALAREAVIEELRFSIDNGFPKYDLEVFGSERTGLALATSDIDLRLIRRGDEEYNKSVLPPSAEDRKAMLTGLGEIRKYLRRQKGKHLKAMLRHARYPLISLQDAKSGIDVQIVLANDTSKSRDLIQRYMVEYPYLRQVYFVIKTVFDQRGLTDVFRGGFGSYSIFMMLVASLKLSPEPPTGAADALINFLQFWGHFDVSKSGVSVDPPAVFDKKLVTVMPEKVAAAITVGLS